MFYNINVFQFGIPDMFCIRNLFKVFQVFCFPIFCFMNIFDECCSRNVSCALINEILTFLLPVFKTYNLWQNLLFTNRVLTLLFNLYSIQGPSWSWSYSRWIYNYLIIQITVTYWPSAKKITPSSSNINYMARL